MPDSGQLNSGARNWRVSYWLVSHSNKGICLKLDGNTNTNKGPGADMSGCSIVGSYRP